MSDDDAQSSGQDMVMDVFGSDYKNLTPQQREFSARFLRLRRRAENNQYNFTDQQLKDMIIANRRLLDGSIQEGADTTREQQLQAMNEALMADNPTLNQFGGLMERYTPFDEESFPGFAQPLEDNRIDTINPDRKLNLAEGGMATYFTRSDEITPEQYQESFIDFYNMPNVAAEVIDTDEEEEDEKPPVVANVLSPVTAGGDEAPGANIFTQTTMSGRPAYDIQDVNYDDYIKNFNQMDEVKTKKGVDASQSEFGDFIKKQLSDKKLSTNIVGGVAGVAMGVGPVFGAALQVAGKLNRDSQLKTAEAIKIAGGTAGSMMSINGQVVHRKPGSKLYNGTIPSGASESIYRNEEITKGYIPGTMVETESDGPDGKPSGSFVTSGKYGLLDEATAKALGGNYDAYGNFHTAYGSAASGTMEAGKALAAQYGVPASSVEAMMAAIRSGTYSKGTFGTVRSVKAADYSNDRMTAIEIAKSFSTEAVQKREAEAAAAAQAEQDRQKQQEINTRTAVERAREEGGMYGGPSGDDAPAGGGPGGTGAGSGDSGVSHGGGYSGGRSGPTGGFKSGGRVGYAPGGPVQQGSPAGFVERPPSQVSEAATVADDKPMSVSEGTFVINAAAVEFAGEEDIADMLKKAYVKAGKKDMGGPSTQEIDIAVSRGEVIVPAHIAKIIGYDRLEKINNRGKAETSKRIKENGQQPAGAAGGGFLTRKKLADGGDVGEDVPMDDRIRLPKSTEKKFKTYLASRQQRGDVERLIDSLDDRERLAVLALVETTAAKDPLESLMGVGQTVINRANSNRKDFKNVNDIPAVLKQRSGRGTGSKMFQYDGLEPKNIKPRLEEVIEGRVPGAVTKMFMAADNLLDPEAQYSPIISKFVTSYTKPDAPLAKDMELNPLMRYSTSIGGHDYYTLEAAPESPDQEPIFEAYKEAKREAAKNKKK